MFCFRYQYSFKATHTRDTGLIQNKSMWYFTTYRQLVLGYFLILPEKALHNYTIIDSPDLMTRTFCNQYVGGK